jgi:hypothetical protein
MVCLLPVAPPGNSMLPMNKLQAAVSASSWLVRAVGWCEQLVSASSQSVRARRGGKGEWRRVSGGKAQRWTPKARDAVILSSGPGQAVVAGCCLLLGPQQNPGVRCLRLQLGDAVQSLLCAAWGCNFGACCVETCCMLPGAASVGLAV